MADKVEPALFGLDLFGAPAKPEASSITAERFTFPPFTILDAKTREWQNRKRAWKDLGIRSEVGRDVHAYNCTAWLEEKGTGKVGDGGDTSVFDPVLTELCYKWWCPEGGQIVDPFAGGSVRGIVAGAMGRKYWGCDLRKEQIEANEAQAAGIKVPVRPVWVTGDSMDTLAQAPDADYVFSCPPYGDLERYSDDPKDLSTMEYHTFLAAYKRIILRACARLKPNRFACFVVGDFRDAKGHYRGFHVDTIRAFEEQKLHLYNDAVLATSTGGAGMRANQFDIGRKLVKIHQNVLVFVKGDWREAVKACQR